MSNQKKKRQTVKVNRSAITGKFVTEADAKASPDTTFKDTIRKHRKHGKK